MTKYQLTKAGNSDENNLSTIFTGGNNTTNNDGSLHIGTNLAYDYLTYNDDTDYTIHMELKINNLDLAQVGINGGIYAYNLTTNRIIHNSTYTYYTTITPSNDDIIHFQIKREGTKIQFTLTKNGNSETITYNDYSRGSNDNCLIRAHGTNSDIDLLSYTRLTKLED